MNYGFARLTGNPISLRDEDEPDRYHLQLYHAVAGAIPLEGLKVLEMSCGRGGGASYIARYLNPRTVVGVDRTESAVASCASKHAERGLLFVCGDALKFPFGDRSFDAVVNVEASHCYPDVPQFFREVRRVLRIGGYFLYADFRKIQDFDAWRAQIEASGLDLVAEREITPNVVRALELNEKYLQEIIEQVTSERQRPLFRQFAGTKGTMINESFRTGKAKYMRFVMTKPRA